MSHFNTFLREEKHVIPRQCTLGILNFIYKQIITILYVICVGHYLAVQSDQEIQRQETIICNFTLHVYIDEI